MVHSRLPAQTPPALPPSTPAAAESSADQLVDQLVENAQVYRATLHSLEAHESIVSKFDEVVVFGKHVYKAEATVRMVRKSPGGPLEESRQITAIDGKPVAPGQGHLPVDLVDDFGDLQTSVFSAQHRRCFNFSLSPHPNPNVSLELTMSPSPDAATLSYCKRAQEGLTGIVRVDPATLQTTHFELTIPVAAAVLNHQITFISADYAPAKIGDKVYWLPITVTARWISGTNGETPFAWVSHYSNYHQFTATSTILTANPE